MADPVSIIGLAVGGQALAWMPAFVYLCVRSLRPNPLQLPLPKTDLSLAEEGFASRRQIEAPRSEEPSEEDDPYVPARGLSSLPSELLTYIDGALDEKDSAALHSVDWARHDAWDPFGAAIHRFESKDLVALQEIRELRKFNPNFSRPTKPFKLNLSNDVTVEELQSIAKHFPNITEINASHRNALTDAGLASLSNLANLRSLQLKGCFRISQPGLASLIHLLNLKNLDLTCCLKIADRELATLAKLTHLTSLYLASCPRITHAGLASLIPLTNLKSLDLTRGRQIGDAEIASLANLKSLTSMTLDGCRQITAASLASLTKLSNLESLDVSGCHQISDASLQSLTNFAELSCLNLGWCSLITDVGLASLARVPKLEAQPENVPTVQQRRVSLIGKVGKPRSPQPCNVPSDQRHRTSLLEKFEKSQKPRSVMVHSHNR